jgi:hypothetical protein
MLAHPFILGVSLALALTFSQAPEFMQQYVQRLGGAIDELTRIVQHFDDDARSSGFDRAGALRLMQGNSERLVRDQGARMEDNISRLARLRAQQDALREGGSLLRFVEFAANVDGPLARKALQDYKPALPLTVAGAISAIGGFFVSFYVLLLTSKWRRRRGRIKVTAS